MNQEERPPDRRRRRRAAAALTDLRERLRPPLAVQDLSCLPVRGARRGRLWGIDESGRGRLVERGVGAHHGAIIGGGCTESKGRSPIARLSF